jgi:hypothetical protein
MSNVVSGNTGSSCQDLKVNRINEAYSKLRISGLTVLPSAEDLELALTRLENMMSELSGTRNICLNYNFEDCPDPNSVTNIPNWSKDGISSLLATRLIPDFNKMVPAQLMAQAASSISSISGRVMRDKLRQVQYPDRMPVGSGNYRYPRWARFYRQEVLPPNNCSTNPIKVGETKNYTISFSQEMEKGESIIDFYTDVSDGLTIDNEVVIGLDIDYSITAISLAFTGANRTIGGAWQAVRFTINTDAGRTLIKDVNFEVVDLQEIANVV